MLLHNNSQKRFKGHFTYFITCKTKDNYPYFKNEILCELFIEELLLCKEIKKFELHAFCLMYDHFHLMVTPDYVVCNMSAIMKLLKENFSRDANKLMKINCDHEYEGDTSTCRLHIREFIKNNTGKIYSCPKFKWQKSYHDHYIRNLKDYQKHFDYTTSNLFKHHLPLDWKYVSTNYEKFCNPFE